MSRTARLFKLMDALRGHRRPVSAARLAEALSVSIRTVYRDMQTLTDLGAPIAGESGVGYRGTREGTGVPVLPHSGVVWARPGTGGMEEDHPLALIQAAGFARFGLPRRG